MPPVAKTNCHNYVPAPNLNVSPSIATRSCPICLLQSHIDKIKDVQIGLSNRGGIFKSKKPDNCWRYIGHKNWINKWRAAKIQCCRFLGALEKLHDDHPDMRQAWGLDEALYLWEMATDECCRVPGYKYLGDAAEGDVSLECTKKLEPIESIPIAIQATREENRPEDDDGWATVTRIWKEGSQSWTLLSEDQGGRPETRNTGLEAINNKPDGFQTFSGDLSEALAEAFDDSSNEGTDRTRSTVAGVSETSNVHLTVTSTQSHKNRVPNLLQSALRRKSPPDPCSRKSVMINPQAAIIPSENDQIITQPHNEHVAAEKHRHRSTWTRRSRTYSPLTWASPEGYEKDDTSYFRMSWFDLEGLMYKSTSKTEDDALTEEAN
ncbi:hypothetical protein GMOD_00001348 [Pyrenophora seminiperda CCB06]|uniref:Uncharacterized protein n=1 Tax=Pyrenophora seminiperda CCB06 TaxID=1302712 RepID=A0A3M7LYW4_9PLEO|nr:hypothetical protein GMOD_00001348 [Pyrenophora seminiperda CCB06]